MKLFSSLIVVAAAGLLLALLTVQHGCASNCGSSCPNTSVYIGDTDNHELAGIITGFALSGPACPPQSGCVGDEQTTTCTHFTVTGIQPGICDFYITFSDRPTEVVHLTFAPTQNSGGSCCQGYPPVGPNIYVIPDSPAGGLIHPSNGPDGGPTNVSLPGDGSTEDAAHDAGADSGPADAQ
jgi:hypothetical protein